MDTIKEDKKTTQNMIKNKKMLTRHRLQNKLSKESRAASRSLSRKEFQFCSSVSLFLEAPVSSSFIRVSYLACIRCWMVFHISVKQAKRKWGTAGPKFTL